MPFEGRRCVLPARGRLEMWRTILSSPCSPGRLCCETQGGRRSLSPPPPGPQHTEAWSCASECQFILGMGMPPADAVALGRGDMATREFIGTGGPGFQLPGVVTRERLASGHNAFLSPSLWFSALKLQAPERASWGGGRQLLCRCQQCRVYSAPTLCPHPSPGPLSAEHPLDLLSGVEVMAASLHWPKHVFG